MGIGNSAGVARLAASTVGGATGSQTAAGHDRSQVVTRVSARVVLSENIECPLGACPSHAILLRRMICRHLRRSRPVNILNYSANTRPVFSSLRPRIRRQLLRFVMKDDSDRILAWIAQRMCLLPAGVSLCKIPLRHVMQPHLLEQGSPLFA